MSSRFPNTAENDSRYPRDRTPPRSLERRSSASFNDGPPRVNEPGHRSNDSYGYQGRGREPAREPPRGPKALIDGPRGGGYIPRARGGFHGRGDTRDRDFRDTREESFPRRGRGQDWGPRDPLDRRPSPVGRDRSRSPPTRDFRDPRDTRDYPPREELRRESRESLPPIASDTFPRGRGAFRGRGRGRGDWDYNRCRGLVPDERENLGPRSRSRERDWERQVRGDRDRDREFDLSRRDDEVRREREDRERDDRIRREPPPFRPDSRNSTGGVPTPITSRSTSTTSVHLANLDRYAQNTRESRDALQDSRSRYPPPNVDAKPWSMERDSGRAEIPLKRAETERYDSRAASPPQAPPVPAFGSIPQRAPTVPQEQAPKPASPSDRSPLIRPSRLGLLEAPREAPSAPKAHTLSHAPTAPKAQQTPERWSTKDLSDPVRRLTENEVNKFGVPRTTAGPSNVIAYGPPLDHVRNISKRFSNGDLDNQPTRPILPVHGSLDPARPSVRKAVEEQGRNGGAPSTGTPSSTLRAPLSDMSNQGSPVRIPTGPRAERAPPSINQPPPPLIRGPPIRGPSMMQRGGRGGAWSWVNPDLPKHTPRGPSIMNKVPAKRDALGEDKNNTGPPTTESAASAIAKWHRAHAPPAITASQHAMKDIAPSQLSPGIMNRMPTTRSNIKEEESDDDDDEEKDTRTASDKDKEEEESVQDGAEDTQMDLDEEDYAEAEKKFNREMEALEAKRPPTPRSHPQLLDLLEELDVLDSALEEKAKRGSVDREASPATVPTGLPSPKVDDYAEMNYKRETSTSPLPIRARPHTPPVESLPFLFDGPPTPFSEIEELQEDLDRKQAVEALIIEELTNRRQKAQSENDSIKEKFAERYKPWRMSVEDFEDARRAEDNLADTSMVEDMPLPAAVPSVVGRRGRIISEESIEEVIKISQETAAREERARREREEPVYVPPETFNPEREAVVPNMLTRHEAQTNLYMDTNNLVDPELALEALCYVPKPDDFTTAEHETFLYNYLLYPKRFGMIAEALKDRDFRDCVQHYYSTKIIVKYKDQEAAFMKTKRGRRLATQLRGLTRPRVSGLMSTFDGMVEVDPQSIALTEKGRPRRAAAPTFGDVPEPELVTPAPTPARRGTGASKENSSGIMSSEKPTATRRTRAPGKEKPGRKPKAQLLAAAPRPSPQKSLPETARGVSKEPARESEPRIDDLESAQLLAGLSSGQPYKMQLYQQAPTEWSTSQPPPISMDQIPQHIPQLTQDQLPPPQSKPAGTPQTSSYWSVPEQQDFYNLVRHFGTNWQAIAATMKTKTHIMIKNFYSRKIKEGPQGQQLEQDAQQADTRIANGEDMGPLPAPTPTGEKRRYMYNILKQEQRPLAPSTTEGVEVDNGSPKPQIAAKTPNPTRFKQDPPKFTAQASAEQGAAQTSEQMIAQGPFSLENRITIPLQAKTQQHVIGPHLGTFIPSERDRVHFSTRDTIKEQEQREMQQRQQLHEAHDREVQRQPDRESLSHHRPRVSQHDKEQAPQAYQQRGPNLMSLLGQPPSTAQSGLTNTPAIEVEYDEKAREFIQLRQRKQQEQQEQLQKIQREQQQHEQQQQRQQQQVMQHHPLQHMLQRQAPLDTPMRRLGSGAFSGAPNHFTPTQSPANASLPMPPMSPPGETLRPSSVPVNASAQQPPPAPPKKSSIMDILNNDSEPQPRKRLSDQQRPAAPTPPPPPPPTYQPAGQPTQLQMSRRETPAESLAQIQQQQRPTFSHQIQQQQQQQQLREPIRNWAAAAQQVGQQRSWMDERPAQAQSAISPPAQSSYLPTSSRPAFQALQRNHVPSPPPFAHPSHSRASSYSSNVPSSHHHAQQQQASVPSAPAEPNLRPSPYASHQHQQQQQHQQAQQQLHIQQVVLEQQQRQAQRQEQEYRLQQQQREAQQQEEAMRLRQQERERYDTMIRQKQEQEERDRRFNRPTSGYYGDNGGAAGRGLGGGYEERR